MTEPSLEDIRKQMRTPAGGILMWAFNLTCDANDILRKQLPQIEDYPHSRDFGNLLQIGTILATLLRVERYLGFHDYTDLHESVAQSIAPSMRETYIPPLQDLAAFLLQSRPTSFAENQIPALNALLDQDERRLATSIGEWLVRKLKSAEPSDAFDLKLVGVLGQLVYVINAQMIASMMLSDKNTLNRIV